MRQRTQPAVPASQAMADATLATHDADRMQASAAEWAPPAGCVVQYSAYNREVQPAEPVIAFARSCGATDALMLETAHANIYRLSGALMRNAVRVWAVPNIEMVRRTELPLYHSFTGVLCHNAYSISVLRYLRPSLEPRLLPFALPTNEPNGVVVHRAAPYDGYGPIRFLLVGGLNAVRRKHAVQVVQAFASAFRGAESATLTVLSQQSEPQLAAAARTAHSVRIVEQHQTYQGILAEYGRHHVVLMLGRAEGIGIGTHEALRAGCAIVTFDHTMYKELVNPAINGWLLPAHDEAVTVGAKLLGNTDAVVRTCTLRVPELARLFREIVSDWPSVARKQQAAAESFRLLFEPGRVLRAWRAALDPTDDLTDDPTNVVAG